MCASASVEAGSHLHFQQGRWVRLLLCACQQHLRGHNWCLDLVQQLHGHTVPNGPRSLVLKQLCSWLVLLAFLKERKRCGLEAMAKRQCCHCLHGRWCSLPEPPPLEHFFFQRQGCLLCNCASGVGGLVLVVHFICHDFRTC